MTVTVERDGPVTSVVLDRPEVRNAVDPANAAELDEAFGAYSPKLPRELGKRPTDEE